MKSYSNMKVYPINWETSKKSTSKDWIVRYVFTDNNGNDHNASFKGMNHIKTHVDRVEETKRLIEEEIYMLERGYNPKTKLFETISDFEIIKKSTSFIDACNIALKSFKGVKSTMYDVENSLKHITKYSKLIRISHIELSKISKGDIKQLLMKMTSDGHSNYRVNKTRSHLSKFFSHFTELDIFDVNFIEGISKLEHTSATKKIIRTEEDWKKFHSIKDLNYSVYVFLSIFLYSGCRFEEMTQVKKEDVDLEKGFFFINLKKGGKHSRAMRPINMHVWQYWKRIFDIAKDNQYLFSFNQMPNDEAIQANSMYDVSSKYLRKAGLNMTGYGLKHTFLNLVSKDFGLAKAAEIAGHTNTKTTEKYAVDWQEHQVERNKNIDICI